MCRSLIYALKSEFYLYFTFRSVSSQQLRERDDEPLHDHGYRAYKEWRRAHHAGEKHHAFAGKIDPEHLHHIISHDAHGQRPVYRKDFGEDEL